MHPILYVVFAAAAVLLGVIGFFAGSVYRRKSAEMPSALPKTRQSVF